MAAPSANPPGLTGDPRIDGLIEPSAWDQGSGALTLTWSPHNFGGTWTVAELTRVQEAFNAWSNVANIRFVRAPFVPDFKLTTADLAVVATGTRLQTMEDAIGLAFTPDPNFTVFELFGTTWTAATYPRSQGDIFIDDPESGGFTSGASDFQTLLHEIGHALGLKHPHDDPRAFAQIGIGGLDNNAWTVMSYEPAGNATLFAGWPITPMPLDILAIQYLYGANMSYHTGNDVYALLNDGKLRTIWDAGGVDTFNAAGAGQGIDLNLAPGSLNFHGPRSMTAIAYNVTIENAVGTEFADRLLGNAAANVLNGGEGNDVLAGAGGANVLIGGKGGDTIDGGPSVDMLEGGPGADILRGGGASDRLFGGSANDNLGGGPRNDWLSGGTGRDSLTGGFGNDSFVFDTQVVATSTDSIQDFEGAGASVLDVIRLSAEFFESLAAPGALDPEKFVSGPNPIAADGDDIILYNVSSGALFYDADGDGPGVAIRFAVLVGSPDALAASDFIVI